jgi:hypothetical protein
MGSALAVAEPSHRIDAVAIALHDERRNAIAPFGLRAAIITPLMFATFRALAGFLLPDSLL